MLSLLNSVARASCPARPASILSVYQDHSPAAGESILTAAEPWNNAEEGFMWIRATPSDLSASSGNQYVLDLNNGGSSPSVGIRIDDASNEQENRYRDDSGNLSSASLPRRAVIEGSKRTFGLTWDNANGEIWLVGGCASQDYSFSSGSFAAAGFSRLFVGSRNGGSETFTGTFEALEVGNKFLSVSELSYRMKHSQSFVIVGAGQSLMGGHWRSQESTTEGGYLNMAETAAQSLTDQEILTLDGTTGASALTEDTNPSSYWWNRANQTPGPAYETFLAEIREYNIVPDWCLWAQGESDSFDIEKEGEISRALYKENLLNTYNRMRSDLNPNMKIGIQGIGRRSGSFSNTGGIQSIREIQQELAFEYEWIHMLGYSYDQALYDEVHLDDAGYETLGARLIRRALDIDGETLSGSTYGPMITAAERSGTTISVTLSHDGGTDFTPSSGIVGFRFFDDTSEIAINSAVRDDASTVTLTLASEPSSGTETLYYCYDDAQDITNANIANVLRDNSPQALPAVPAMIKL